MSFLYKHSFLGQGSSYGEHRKLVPHFSLLTTHSKNAIFFVNCLIQPCGLYWERCDKQLEEL